MLQALQTGSIFTEFKFEFTKVLQVQVTRLVKYKSEIDTFNKTIQLFWIGAQNAATEIAVLLCLVEVDIFQPKLLEKDQAIISCGPFKIIAL